MCDVKGDAHSDKGTKNYHPTLQFPSMERFSVFQPIVLVLRHTSLLFYYCCTLPVQHSRQSSNLDGEQSVVLWSI